MICPVCQQYFEENCFNPDCVERRAIEEVMSKTKNKASSAAGRVLNDPTSSPDELSAAGSALAKSGQSLSPMKDLIALITAASEDETVPEYWRKAFREGLERVK